MSLGWVPGERDGHLHRSFRAVTEIPEVRLLVLGDAVPLRGDALPVAYIRREHAGHEDRVGGYNTSATLDGADAEIIPVQNNPVLVFSYIVKVGTEGGATVEASVKNVGDVPTSTARFVAEFQDRNREATASVVSDRLTIEPET